MINGLLPCNFVKEHQKAFTSLCVRACARVCVRASVRACGERLFCYVPLKDWNKYSCVL